MASKKADSKSKRHLKANEVSSAQNVKKRFYDKVDESSRKRMNKTPSMVKKEGKRKSKVASKVNNIVKTSMKRVGG